MRSIFGSLAGADSASPPAPDREAQPCRCVLIQHDVAPLLPHFILASSACLDTLIGRWDVSAGMQPKDPLSGVPHVAGENLTRED